ncbi:MAG TPA: oxidoreductase [Solimonas sp.]|nr:oxidoreductase [Solimonas sp.]
MTRRIALKTQAERVWLITGCSKGLGRTLAAEVLARGDRVVATARNASSLAALAAEAPARVLALALDVTDQARVGEVVQQATERFGRIDVLVNNAGYGLAGAVEEVSDAEARAQMETNFFGALACTRAVLPGMRARKSGHILQISSIAGFAATPGLGIYNASKFALEGFSEALAQEVAPLGIRVTIVEPGPFRTDWAGPSLIAARTELPDYAATAGRTRGYLRQVSGQQAGDPQRAARAMIQVVESAEPPLRLPLGAIALGRVRGKLAAVATEVEAWQAVGLGADFPK